MGMDGGFGPSVGGDLAWFLVVTASLIGLGAVWTRRVILAPRACRLPVVASGSLGGPSSGDAIAILKERYVRGDVGTHEFKERLEALIASEKFSGIRP